MAKKSPAELKQEAKELGSTIANLRKKTHNFALMLSKDGVILEVDPRKPPATLRKNANAAGGGPKGAMGQMRCSGKVIQLTVEDDDVPDMVLKAAKKHFQSLGLAYKFEVMQSIQEDEAGGEEDAADEPKAKAEQEDQAEEAPAERRGSSAATETRVGGAGAPETTAESSSSDGAVEPENSGYTDEINSTEVTEDEDQQQQVAEEMADEMEDIEPDIIHIQAYGGKGEIKKTEALKGIYEAAAKAGDKRKGDKILQSIKMIAKKTEVVLNEGSPPRDPAKAEKLAKDLAALKKELARLPG